MPPKPQEAQVPRVPPMPHAPFFERDMTNMELRDAQINFTPLMMAQAHVVSHNFVAQDNQRVGPQPLTSTPAARIRDFMRMNPPTFHGPKVDKHTQGFIDEVFKDVNAMGVNPREKQDLAAYQLKYVVKVLFELWRDEIPFRDSPINLQVFKVAFLDRFYPLRVEGEKVG